MKNINAVHFLLLSRLSRRKGSSPDARLQEILLSFSVAEENEQYVVAWNDQGKECQWTTPTSSLQLYKQEKKLGGVDPKGIENSNEAIFEKFEEAVLGSIERVYEKESQYRKSFSPGFVVCAVLIVLGTMLMNGEGRLMPIGLLATLVLERYGASVFVIAMTVTLSSLMSGSDYANSILILFVAGLNFLDGNPKWRLTRTGVFALLGTVALVMAVRSVPLSGVVLLATLLAIMILIGCGIANLLYSNMKSAFPLIFPVAGLGCVLDSQISVGMVFCLGAPLLYALVILGFRGGKLGYLNIHGRSA